MAWQRTGDPEAVKSWFLRETPAYEIVPELTLERWRDARLLINTSLYSAAAGRFE